MRPIRRHKPVSGLPIQGRGFTLIEAVMVIAITGIIGAMIAVFMVPPVKGYFDAVERAALTDIADTALRRISRDLHLALPNSVRITGTSLEFMLTRTGGRYRSEKGAASDDELIISSGTDTMFEVLGPAMTFVAGDELVIYNLGSGMVGADAYAGNTAATHNRRPIVSTGTTTSVQITSTSPLPFDSPNHTFFVVETPVSYVCDLGAGTLVRYSGYTATSGTAATTMPAGATSIATLATNVTACDFNYAGGITERSGVVTLSLSITRNNETVTLVQQIHVNNAP
jgi:MSHA biogenesis protein MshO